MAAVLDNGFMTVDLNADVGEGWDDKALFPFLTSVNVACGGHAGDPGSIEKTLLGARALHLAIGAHPGYEDRENFGRVEMGLGPGPVEDLVARQLDLFARIAASAGITVTHVKPHGALYNRAARDLQIARAIARAVARANSNTALVGLPGSDVEKAARELGLRFIPEGFADRRYLSDGSLAPRSRDGSVIRDPADAAAQAIALAQGLPFATLDGEGCRMQIETICIHSDSPGAAATAEAVHEALSRMGLLSRGPRQ
jgi:UPF0271 protein